MSQLAFPLLLNFTPTSVLCEVVVSVYSVYFTRCYVLCFTGAIKCLYCQVIREEVLDACSLFSLPSSSISGKYTLNKISSKQVSPKCIVPYTSLQIQQQQLIHTVCICLLSKKKKKTNKITTQISNYILATHAFNLPSHSKLFHSILGCTYNQLQVVELTFCDCFHIAIFFNLLYGPVD